MFRVRLAMAIAVSFGFVLFLGGMLYWLSAQMALNVQRGQTAYEAFDRYERLSQEAYRHFKQRLDSLITDSPAAEAGAASSQQRLYEAMEALRNTAVQAAGEGQATPVELERVARFTAFLEAGEYRFGEVERLRSQGKRGEAVAALSKFSEEEIDGKFQPLIDAAIAAERGKAGAAQEKLEFLVRRSRWIALLAAAAAALFSLVSGLLLLRGVRKPIEALLQGTDAIAMGNLDHRINLASRDEFGHLAAHFNQMADELESQQEKLREGRAALEKRVAERTSELNQLNAQLRRMDAERREFLADISHELRTPITVIRGEAEVTLRGAGRDAEEYREALQRIAELSVQLGKYVNDLLFLARAETANLQFEWDRLDLAQLVADAAADFQVMAQENAMAVGLDAPAGPVWVRGDKQRLRQVLFILGDNACRYSKPGGHIAAVLKTDGAEAVFSLSDQGIGIPAQDLERVFERHFRSRNARDSRDDGSGLGLPLAKAILKAHGGRIGVASVENAGATFTLALPLLSREQNTFEHERETP